MSNQQSQRQPPRGLNRLLFRAPIWLYRLKLGWLLGDRFLLLNHVGRKSGQTRQAVLEVVDHSPATGTYTVASGYGAQSDWYQNLRQTPEVTIQIGRREWPVTAVRHTSAESGAMMVRYAQEHPAAARNLSRMLGINVDGGAARYREIGRELVPFVSFVPRR